MTAFAKGKIERWHRSLKGECLRPGVPGSAQEARRWVANYVDYYNRLRLHSAIGYVAPLDRLEGRAEAIWAERDRKLEEARRKRQLCRQETSQNFLVEPQATAGPELIGAGEAPAAGLN